MTEEEFFSSYDPEAYERPSVTIDLVLTSVVNGKLAVLLRQRDDHPFKGDWALPGGFVGSAESLDAAAHRLLAAEARMEGAYIEQLYSFGDPGRDPRTRVITIAYFALLPETSFAAALSAGEDLKLSQLDVPWVGEAGGQVTAHDSNGAALPLAFDHADILGYAVKRLRGKLNYSAIAFALVPDRFTLRALQDVHEAILGVAINKPAFRRRMIDRGWIMGTGTRETGTSFRPAEIYVFNPDFEC